MNFQAVCTTVGVWTKKHMPDILMGLGLTGIVTGTVMACKKSTEVEPIFDKHNRDLKLARTFRKDDVKKVYVNTGIKLAKHYAVPVIVYISGIACTLTSHIQLNRRNAALSAAYVTLLTSFEGYRAKVVDKYGKEVDEEFNLGLKKIKTKNKKDQKYKMIEDKTSSMDRFFDEVNSIYYDPIDNADLEYNYTFLRNIQNWANDKLKVKPFVCLNEVYEALGMDKTKEGQYAGWMIAKDPEKQIGPTEIDFGLYNVDKPQVREFLQGKEKSIFLHFNATPNLLDLI